MEKRSCLLPGYLVFRRLSGVFWGIKMVIVGMELGPWIRFGLWPSLGGFISYLQVGSGLGS